MAVPHPSRQRHLGDTGKGLPSPLGGRVAKGLAVLLLILFGCADEAAISVKLVPAHSADPDQTLPADWLKIDFAGGQRSPAGTYLLSPDPLLTEWNFVAAKHSPSQAEQLVVAVRLNAYAKRQLDKFCADPTNLKRPLVLLVDDKPVDVFPLLRPPGDRLLLYGFSPGQAKRLEIYLKSK